MGIDARAELRADVLLREMRPADLPGVLLVEAASFVSPWTAAMFADELAGAGSWAQVAGDADGRVVGFLVCRLYGDLWHVMDLAVEPGRRGCGVGARLLDAFLEAATVASEADFTLEVRPSNAAALALYQSRGFQMVGLRHHYYADTGEDAVIMIRPADGPLAEAPTGREGAA
jgi:[ribosomal protein S18]-alanine N-acetyltransferase